MSWNGLSLYKYIWYEGIRCWYYKTCAEVLMNSILVLIDTLLFQHQYIFQTYMTIDGWLGWLLLLLWSYIDSGVLPCELLMCTVLSCNLLFLVTKADFFIKEHIILEPSLWMSATYTYGFFFQWESKLLCLFFACYSTYLSI
jgi:hypothetical protein